MFARLCSWENLLLAFQRASKGKRGQSAVAAFEHRLEDNLLALHDALTARTYRPGRHASFFVHEPKRRLISAAPFPDRVVHHALCNVIAPLLERSFVRDSYANQVGKGTHRALDRVQCFARRHEYVLQCDVRQFFPSIDHAILRDTLGRAIRDPGVLWLVDVVLDAGAGILDDQYEMAYFTGDDLFAVNRPRGLPIGNLTSQLWANVYLSGFDHFVKRELRCAAYVRYVDDLVLFADDKRALWTWRDAIVRRLEELRLTIHPGAHPRPVTEGIPFLGFVTFPWRRRLKRRKVVHFARRFRALGAAFAAGDIPAAKVTESVRAWGSHAAFGNTVGLMESLLSRPLPPRGHVARAASAASGP